MELAGIIIAALSLLATAATYITDMIEEMLFPLFVREICRCLLDTVVLQ